MKPKTQIEYRRLDELKKLENNPRTIKKKDFETLKKSVHDNPDYFEARPLILSDRTGELVILAGNMRYEAAKALGMEQVPTVTLHGLSEEREREIIVRDNINNGDWDFDELLNNWDPDKLQDWGIHNIKQSIEDEKPMSETPPSIVASFITLEYNDEIQLQITDETAEQLMAEMVAYKQDKGTYDGFWDARLKRGKDE
jgi:hypothetical protein